MKWQIFKAIIKRDAQARLRSGSSLAAVFSMPFVLFVLGYDEAWHGFMLAILLSLPYLYEEDINDGSLDYLILGELPVELVVTAKIIAHWLVFVVPLLPMNLLLVAIREGQVSHYTAFAYLFGSIGLVLIGSVGASLTAVAKKGGALLFLLVLPLYLPILIFGSEASAASLVLLVAMNLVLVIPSVWIAATALRLNK